MRTYVTSTLLGSISVILLFVGCAKTDEAEAPRVEANLSVVGVEPMKPMSLYFYNLTPRKVRVRWVQDGVNTDRYVVRLARMADGMQNGSYIFGSAVTLYANDNPNSDFNRRETEVELQPDTDYRIRIQAINDNGPVIAVSPEYLQFHSFAEAVAGVNTPGNFHGSDTTSSSLRLGWNYEGGTTYRIDRWGSAGYYTIDVNSTSTLNVYGLSASSTYWFRIRAERGGLVSNYVEIAVTTTQDSLAAPSAPTYISTTTSSIVFGFVCNPAVYDQGYIYLNINGGFAGSTYISSAYWALNWYGLQPYTQYAIRYACRRISDGAWTAYSEPLYMTTY